MNKRGKINCKNKIKGLYIAASMYNLWLSEIHCLCNGCKLQQEQAIQ